MNLVLIMKIESISSLYSDRFVEAQYIPSNIRFQDMLAKAKLIKRFTGNDLPAEVVCDTVYTHTLRAIALSESINISELILQRVQYTVLIHDFPEVQNLINMGRDRDVTSLEKELDPDLEAKVAEMELEVAKEILSYEEFNLYLEFEDAGNFLKTGRIADSKRITAIGIFSQLLDKIDANLTLHRYLSRWFRSSDYDPSKIIPEQSLTFYTRQYQYFVSNLNMLSNSIYFNDYINLLNLQNQYIESLWSG